MIHIQVCIYALLSVGLPDKMLIKYANVHGFNVVELKHSAKIFFKRGQSSFITENCNTTKRTVSQPREQADHLSQQVMLTSLWKKQFPKENIFPKWKQNLSFLFEVEAEP